MTVSVPPRWLASEGSTVAQTRPPAAAMSAVSFPMWMSAPGYGATRERLSACLFIGRPLCEGATADPAHDASEVGEIAVVKHVAEHVLQEVVVALAGLPGR